MAQKPPTRPPRAAAPYRPPSAAERRRSLGTTCLVLAVLELLYCLQKLATQMFGGAIVGAQRSFLPTAQGVPTERILAAAKHLSQQIAPFEVARTLPFLAATAVLLWIALRLREGDPRALSTARTWALAAFVPVAISLVVQVVWVLPPTMEYQREIMKSLPTFSGADPAQSVEVQEMVSSMTAISAAAGVVIGAAVLSAWPIVLFVWAGRLLREARPGPVAE
jgi:hypothetical protein